jgi:hypothetical protein
VREGDDPHAPSSPSPCDDPTFDVDAPWNLTFDAEGHLLGEPFRFDDLQIVVGDAPSVSDDGRWLVTSDWEGPDYEAGGPADRRTGHVIDLTTGERRDFPLCYGGSHPTISGDGSTLLYVRADADGRTLVVLDRATLTERPVASGVISDGWFSRAPTISNDARRAVMWTHDDPDRTVGVRVDLETGIQSPLLDPRGQHIYGGTISGDGENVTYWSFTHEGDYDAAELVIDGEGVRALTGVDGYDAISDDGCEVAAACRTVPYAGGTPVLGLGVFVDGERVASTAGAEANVPVASIALSGDGGTAAFIVQGTADEPVLARLRLRDGRVETQALRGCGVDSVDVSGDGAVIALGVFDCDGANRPYRHVRVFRPGVW